MSPREPKTRIDHLTNKLTAWIGTTSSILAHSVFFIGIFALKLFGVPLDTIMLILTTAVSLEAIYLAIFIQMTVNRHTESLEEVEDDIEEIQEDFRDLEDNVEGLSEGIDKIQEEESEEQAGEAKTQLALGKIERDLQKLVSDIEQLKKLKPPIG